jgi:hypothetical protein
MTPKIDAIRKLSKNAGASALIVANFVGRHSHVGGR